jgi:hypothetical protein
VNIFSEEVHATVEANDATGATFKARYRRRRLIARDSEATSGDEKEFSEDGPLKLEGGRLTSLGLFRKHALDAGVRSLGAADTKELIFLFLAVSHGCLSGRESERILFCSARLMLDQNYYRTACCLLELKSGPVWKQKQPIR